MRKLVFVAAAAALLGVAGIAIASTPGAATAACYNNFSGALRVDVDGTGCRAKETSIELGAPLQTRLVMAEGDAPAHDYAAAFAACPAGHAVLGGGWSSSSINPDVQPFENAPIEIDGVQGWYVVVINESDAPTVHFTASAICAPGVSTGFPE
jgi:hypothetical protein